MSTLSQQHTTFLRRRTRTRKALAAHQELPRLTVFRSLRHIFAQVIDDKTGSTLVSASDIKFAKKATKTERAEEVGKMIADLALSKDIKAVRFDRGAYKYHGRVAHLADAAREAGLTL